MLGILLGQVTYTMAANCIVLPKAATHICRLSLTTYGGPPTVHHGTSVRNTVTHHRVKGGSGWLSHTCKKRAPMDINELCGPKLVEGEHWSSYRHVRFAYDDRSRSNKLCLSQ